jgi:hypothetical protein
MSCANYVDTQRLRRRTARAAKCHGYDISSFVIIECCVIDLKASDMAKMIRKTSFTPSPSTDLEEAG